MNRDMLNNTVHAIAQNYVEEKVLLNDPNQHFPNRGEIVNIVNEIRRIMFPRYFGAETPTGGHPEYFIGERLIRVRNMLHTQLFEALMFRDSEEFTAARIDARAQEIADTLIEKIPDLQSMLLKDVDAAYDGDPAAQSKEEVIFSYPGFYAVFVYRIAHELYELDVPLIPRIMTEYAHARTGVDINAGAKIGEYFFIDHATGVVIGETTIIGNHVKIYQGVTLGALSLRAGQKLAGKKRHPTIEDNVTIYSNASVLGGETIIGEGSVIAGSSFVTSSIPKNARVTLANQEISVRQPGEKK